MSSDPSKASGNVKSTVGKMEQAVGETTGLQSWETSGKKREAEGETETKQAQAQGYVEATKDRIVGAVDNMVGSVTGNTSKEVSGEARNEKGKVQQEVNKP